MTDNDKLFYTYCGTDCCVTSECNAVMDAKLMPGQRRHYQFNLQLLAPLLFMELKGIRYDHEKAKAKYAHVQKWVYVLQDMLNRAAGRTLPAPEDTAAWVQLVRDRLCLSKPRRREEVTKTRTFKNGRTKTTVKTVSTPAEIKTLEDCREFALPSQAGAMRRVQTLLKHGGCSARDRGELSTLLDRYVKVNSTGAKGDACWFLYEHCGFPRQFQKEGNRLTTRPASDDEALLHIWLKTKDKRSKLFLKLRRMLTELETLAATVDDDKRIRTGYNVVATKTGRIAAYASPTGNGYNTQTTTKKDRDLFLADVDHDMWQRDLSSADAYTVAAHAARHGDPTMLDDMKAGLKPAKIVCLLHDLGPSVNKMDREQLRELCAKVSESSWLYHASKATVYGSSYGMYERTMSENLLIQSFKKSGKPIAVEPKVCRRLQELFFSRYWGIKRWHEDTERRLKTDGYLLSPSGLLRRFYARKDDNSTLRDALSHEPQNNTTFVINTALLKMWRDPENRREDGSLHVEPLHQIHDAALFQGLTSQREWISKKSDEWFTNPIAIAGQEIIIPAGKEFGSNWKDMTKWKKSVYLGRFKTAQEAASAYDKAAEHFFGDYALTNRKLHGAF